MESLDLDDTLNTQTLRLIRHQLLGDEDQSEDYPQPQTSNADGGPSGSAMRPSLPKATNVPSHSPQMYSCSPGHDRSRRIAKAGHHVPPRLAPSKSSPVVPSANERKIEVGRMYHSFAGLPEGAGDTQPIDSQVFVQYSDMLASRSHLAGLIPSMGTGQHTRDGATSDEGDTGFIDLVGNFKEPELSEDDLSSLDGVTDEPSPGSQYRVQPNTSALFKQPKTPAANGKKRNSRGEVVSSQAKTSATRTPGSALAAIFGNAGPGIGMSMTQVFGATQAASSPLPDGLHSDPIFDRPSPNLNLRHSSPTAMPVSSPIRPLTSEGLIHRGAANEPLDVYLPMKQSQDQRLQRLRAEDQRQAEAVEGNDDFDGSMTDAERRAAWRRQQAKIREKARTSFMDLTAPGRGRSRQPGQFSNQLRQRSATDISSELNLFTPGPRSSALKARRTILPSDDFHDFVTSDMEGDEDAQVSENGVQVPMTSSRQSQVRDNGVNSPTRGSLPLKASLEVIQEHADASTATQKTVAVADSQGDVVQEQKSFQPLLHIPSSIGSDPYAERSQYSSPIVETRAVLSQNTRAAIETSSAPRPPQRLTQSQDAKMPSSPPLVAHDDNDESLNKLVEEEVELIGGDDMLFRPPAVAGIPSPNPLSANAQSKCVKVTGDARSSGLTSAESPQQASAFQTSAVEVHAGATVNSNNTEAFETAKSHSTTSSLNKITQDSPQIGKIRKLTDIAAQLSPKKSSFESADLDINILTEEDQQFLDLMSGSSPVRPSKRRRVYGQRSILQEPALKVNIPKPVSTPSALEIEKHTSPATNFPEPDAARSTANVEQPPSPTPPSAKKREQRGAHAAARARKAVAVKKQNEQLPPTLKQPAKTQKAGKVPKKTYGSIGTRKQRSLKILEVAGISQALQSESHDGSDAGPRCDTIEVHRPLPAEQVNIVNELSENPAIVSNFAEEPENVPNRVLALFKGGKILYYPATCIGIVHTDGVRFRIRFDDGTIDILDSLQVRKLDLRVGDLVKVDLPKMRATSYVVTGFKDQTTSADSTASLEAESENYVLTDVHGYQTVRLTAKTRDSLPTPDPTSGETVDVPITSIYVTATMWSRFADRKFGRSADIVGTSRLATPSNIPSAPPTPSSRARRHTASTAPAVPFAHIRQGSNLFTNMAFAVTLPDQLDHEKQEAIKLIIEHGGQLLESGFDMLFDLSQNDPPSPKKSREEPLATSAEKSEQKDNLRLLPTAQTLGFTALVADRYCRRAKYMQALALDLPCLHYRWLADCISASAILPFQKYLLPAGESAFLFGAVRSRALAPYNPLSEEAKLENVLKTRELLLGGKSVLLVMGKGKAEQRRMAYLFLTYALGAASVGRVRDLQEAKRSLRSKEWDWVYVDGIVADAEKVFLGSSARSSRDRQERHFNEEAEVLVTEILVNERKVKVVSDEFVIQSLILGSLMET